MVDVNYTILVQLANFILLIFVLNALLLRPVLKHLKEREDKISTSHEEAKGNAAKAEAMLAQFDHELADARLKANQTYNALRQEGVAVQRARLADIKEKAQAELEKAQAEIVGEAGKAREALRTQMDKLPGEIASKLLGRKV